mmetsp:Transcript_6589/g.22692  ORF Transcript_6589/g.22692 Transcript_6589/m.22692 type:complete len:262 (-) Transcript_6589:178-963(-)
MSRASAKGSSGPEPSGRMASAPNCLRARSSTGRRSSWSSTRALRTKSGGTTIARLDMCRVPASPALSASNRPLRPHFAGTSLGAAAPRRAMRGRPLKASRSMALQTGPSAPGPAISCRAHRVSPMLYPLAAISFSTQAATSPWTSPRVSNTARKPHTDSSSFTARTTSVALSMRNSTSPLPRSDVPLAASSRMAGRSSLTATRAVTDIACGREGLPGPRLRRFAASRSATCFKPNIGTSRSPSQSRRGTEESFLRDADACC